MVIGDWNEKRTAVTQENKKLFTYNAYGNQRPLIELHNYMKQLCTFIFIFLERNLLQNRTADAIILNAAQNFSSISRTTN